MSITIFDIDDFKKVNDNKGHVYGDQVLADVASLIKNNIRKNDIAGRYGGEEFMIIFPNTVSAVAQKISERIRKAVEENNFLDGFNITISAGVCQYNGESIIDFIHCADINLYEAKRNGKNKVMY